MADSIKKTSEMNELLDEAKDMELGQETGAGIINPIMTQIYGCGLVRTISAECIASHRSCNPFRK